jgi:hypothetical protein
MARGGALIIPGTLNASFVSGRLLEEGAAAVEELIVFLGARAGVDAPIITHVLLFVLFQLFHPLLLTSLQLLPA